MRLKYIYASLVALTMAACGSKSDYRNAIPSKVAAVASVDLKSLSEDSGISGGAADNGVRNRLKLMLKSGLSGADELIDKAFDDVSETGLGLSDKVYVFAGEQAKIGGLLVKVVDEDKLTNLLDILSKQNVCEKVREDDGCSWTVMGNILLAYKSHALLLIMNNKGGDPSSMMRQASMWLRQEEGEGFSSSRDFQMIDSRNSDIVAWNSLEVFPSEIINPIIMGVSAELSLKDLKAVSAIDFNKGKIEVDIETAFEDKVMKDILEKKQTVMLPIKGNYLDMFPSNTSFWSTANIKGGDFFDFICNNPSVRQYFEKSMLPIDFASVFEAIDGDVVLSMSGNGSKDFIALADIKSHDFLNSFEQLKSMAAMSGGQVIFRDYGENGYEFKTYDGSIVDLPSGPVALWIGVQGNKLYITNNESLISRRVLGLSLRDKEWGKRVEGQRFFMVSDFSSLSKFLTIDKATGFMPELLELLGGLDYLTVESSEGNNIHIEVIMKNKDRNPLSVILNQ